MGRKFRDRQKMCAGDNIGRESSPPAHHFTEIDGNENKNTVRYKLIDILEQKVSRDRGDHKADQTRQGKLQRILGGCQHGKNTDDTGLGLELQSQMMGRENGQCAGQSQPGPVKRPSAAVLFHILHIDLHYTVPLFLPLSVSILSDKGTDILSISVFFLVICYNFVRYRIPVISETCSVTGIGNP